LRQLFAGIDASFSHADKFRSGRANVIGWRGLKDSSSDIDRGTAKTKDYSGVFGFSYNKFEQAGNWINGRFAVNYFPGPDEKLVVFFFTDHS